MSSLGSIRLIIVSIAGLHQSPDVIVERSEVIIEQLEGSNILFEASLREAEPEFCSDSMSPFSVSKNFPLKHRFESH